MNNVYIYICLQCCLLYVGSFTPQCKYYYCIIVIITVVLLILSLLILVLLLLYHNSVTT